MLRPTSPNITNVVGIVANADAPGEVGGQAYRVIAQYLDNQRQFNQTMSGMVDLQRQFNSHFHQMFLTMQAGGDNNGNDDEADDDSDDEADDDSGGDE
jgi:hypothetical protein